MKFFSDRDLKEISERAASNSRGRQHLNLHKAYSDKCQVLFNTIFPGSYIRPHRHILGAGDEILIVMSGRCGLISFSNSGAVESAQVITPMSEHLSPCFGVQIPAGRWHTILPLEMTVLLEIKEGPFVPEKAKEFPIWAPSEGSVEVSEYYSFLISHYTDFDQY